MNKIHPSSPNYYNIFYSGPSGPQATYPQVYDKIDNIPGQEVMSMLDFSIIREIKDLLENKKGSSATESVMMYSNSWIKLKDQDTKKVSIFNDTNNTFEIKQTPFPSLRNYDHSTSFVPETSSGFASGVNPLYGGWGDFKTSLSPNFELTNFPILARNTLSYLNLPEDFDTKSWQISFNIRTTAPEGWTGWNPDWTLGNGYVLNMFNTWSNYPSPVGVYPNSLNQGFDSRSNFNSNSILGEEGVKGYTLFISDPKVRSSKAEADLFPDFKITGAYISGNGLLETSSNSYNLILLSSGLNNNASNGNVRLNLMFPHLSFRVTGLQKHNEQVIKIPKTVSNRETLSISDYLQLGLEVERTLTNGINSTFTRYINAPISRIQKTGGAQGNWSNFIEYSWYQSPPIPENLKLTANTRTFTLMYGDNVLASSQINLANYPYYNSLNKIVLQQKGGLFGVYIENNLGVYDLVLEHYDRFYYARSKVGKTFAIGSVIKNGLYGYHNVSDVYINNQRVDLNSDNSINNYLNFNPALASIKLYPNTAIDLKVIDSNQIYIKTTGAFQNLKYRWEN